MEILSVIYLLAFAFSGVLISDLVFSKDKPLRRIFFGLVFGLAMLLWLPTLFAFLINFTLLAQLLALFTAVVLGIICCVIKNKRLNAGKIIENKAKPENIRTMLWTTIPLLIIGWVLLLNHTIVSASNGSLHVGQCTYGDLCMHLGFISSISVQQTFPPDYSILPGTPLGYPFLCDSVSSTFYTLGSSLRFAALLPAMYAYLITVFGVYFFFESWFKRSSITSFATYLFFIGGGLGFAYIFNNEKLLAAEGIDRWKEMLEGFYLTPTNIPAQGLRWVNTIADMLVPQRATLFGWALLFPCLQLLYRAVMERENRLFIPLGVLAGCLPLVHTHSFLALGIISIFLMIGFVGSYLRKAVKTQSAKLAVPIFGMAIALALFGIIAGKTSLIMVSDDTAIIPSLIIVFIGIVFTAIIAICTARAYAKGNDSTHVLFTGIVGALGVILSTILLYSLEGGGLLGIVAAAALAIIMAILMLRGGINLKHDPKAGKHLGMFALFGVIAVVLAAPQLLGFTFKQSVGEQFMRWSFNWANESDGWLWFYIKNLGLIFIFMLPAFLSASKRTKAFYGGSLLIWLICEFVLFQPNPYDNNKLLFIWFAFTCGIVAEYLVMLFDKLTKAERNEIDCDRELIAIEINKEPSNDIPWGKWIAPRLVALFVIIALFLSGTLTLVREYISGDHLGVYTSSDGGAAFGYIESGYEVVSAPLVKLTEFIKENTERDATILTHNNHNNAVAMLTGRNIFCGSGTFLYYHGVNYQPRQEMLSSLYENPANTLYQTAAKYDIDYVLISSVERHTYHVDQKWFESNLECVYSENGIYLYRVDAN
ncbi:MAG: hypothetical protein J1E60_04260 [Christensenellaceae bacterium]|nr:hypothetical protein [Christensenellaceae bacterium]